MLLLLSAESIVKCACPAPMQGHMPSSLAEVSPWNISFVRLSLLTMTNSNQMFEVLLFVRSKMADETNLSAKLSVADRKREV